MVTTYMYLARILRITIQPIRKVIAGKCIVIEAL